MTGQLLDSEHARYLAQQRHGVLATIAPSGSPQAKPVGFRYDPQRGTIDIAGYDMEHSAKFRNVGIDPRVAFTVDDAPDPEAGAAGVRFAEIRGIAEQVRLDDPGDATRRDNLHHPRTDALRGSQRVHARRSSVALQIQKAPSPLLALAVLGAGATAVHSLWSSRRR